MNGWIDIRMGGSQMDGWIDIRMGWKSDGWMYEQKNKLKMNERTTDEEVS